MCALQNLLFYRDNLDILRNRDYFPDKCVDLIYLDPPFNSSRDIPFCSNRQSALS